MLLLTQPVRDPLWRLPDGAMVFRDHADQHLLHYLPAELDLIRAPDGTPGLFLLRYSGDGSQVQGGMLRFRLGFTPLSDAVRSAVNAAGWQLRPAAFSGARFRLQLRSLEQDASPATADWHAAMQSGSEIAADGIGLNARETQFLEQMLAGGASAVQIDLDLRFAGLVEGCSWLVSADRPALKEMLRQRLPAGPVREEQIAAAFVSLPQGAASPLTLRALEPGAVLPERDTFMSLVAANAAATLFQAQPSVGVFDEPLYVLPEAAATDAGTVAWDLLPNRQRTSSHQLHWQIAPFLATLDTPEKKKAVFPSVSTVSPFSAVQIFVINRVPYDLAGLQKATVDVRFVGAAGVPEFRSFTFDGSVDVRTVQTFFPAAGDLQLTRRITAVYAPPNGTGWPTVRRTDYEPVRGLMVDVSRAALKTDFVRVEVEPSVFLVASSVDVQFYGTDRNPLPPPLAEVILTQTRPATSVPLPNIDPAQDVFTRVLVSAAPPAIAAPLLLRSDLVVDRTVRIAGSYLEVLDPDRITIQLDDTAVQAFAHVEIDLAGSPGQERTFTLHAGQPLVWNVFRASIFDPIQYRYRLRTVSVTTDGKTLPEKATGWIVGKDLTIQVSAAAAALVPVAEVRT